ncbi:retrovirus-related Pol polyprotein from transposon 412 [Trichonephila clavipes]|nr:retrovirus-related Pol polyprotein from transposon 412 [Trichonephila clavipes]
MCEGLQQTPAEVTAAESVRNAPRTGDGRREAFLTWRFLTVRLKKQTGRRPLNAGPAVEKGICREAAGHAKALKLISAFQKGGVGKLINDHLVGRRLPDFGKPHIPVCQISTKSTDIADPFILGLDFLKEHGFTLDFNKNELRSIHEEVTIFKIKHRTESIRQVTANENITIPPRTEIIVPGYIGNDVSFNSGLIGSAENKANGLLIASTLVDLSRKTIPVRICNVTENLECSRKVKCWQPAVQ